MYILKGDFSNYTQALNINLNDIIKNGFDVAEALDGLNSVELGATLDFSLKASDIINWAYQMTNFMTGKNGNLAKYLYFFVGALTTDGNGNTIGYDGEIAFSVSLKVYLEMANIVSQLAAGDGLNLATALDGARIYVEIDYKTTLHDSTYADPAKIKLWVEVRNGKLYLYIDSNDLGDVIGFGDFFSYIAIEGIDLGSMFSSGEGASSAAEAITAAASSDGETNTGILPESIWGILNMIIGRLMFARDFVTIGLNENLLGDLVKMFGEENDTLAEIIDFLPKMFTTNNSDTSGVTINFAGTEPSVDINAGFTVGTDYYLTVTEYNTMFGYHGKYNYDNGVNWANGDPVYTKNADGTYTLAGAMTASMN
ncbi:MAG: hypothetical protein K2M36_01580, partial [Clostridia bacterium]|nr:hypothetical protein [Clostridia bacterium]